MGKHRVPFYFVLYLVAICSGFVAIKERDELMEEMKSEVRKVAALLADSLTISAPTEVSKVTYARIVPVHCSTATLWSIKEKESIVYEWKPIRTKYGIITADVNKNTGGIDFRIPIVPTDIPQTDTLVVRCWVKRLVPDFFSEEMFLGDSTVKQIISSELNKELPDGKAYSKVLTILIHYRLPI